MRDTEIRLVPWGLILLLLPLVIFLPPLLRSPPKDPIPVLGKPAWEAKSQGTGGILSLRFSDSDDYLLSSCGGAGLKGRAAWDFPLPSPRARGAGPRHSLLCCILSARRAPQTAGGHE